MAVHEVIPTSVPGLRVYRHSCDALHVGMKEKYAIARTTRGRSEWWTRGRLWRSEPGSIQLKQPGDVHRDVARDGPISFSVVLLPPADVARLRDESEITTQPHFVPGDERARPYHRLHDAIDAGADRLTLEVALTEAIATFAVANGVVPDRTRPVRRALEVLHDRLADTITLDDLARHAGLDKFHLCRAFRAQVGMPPHAYLTHLRISRAKALLASGVRASDVAPRVGFYDQSQLNRHFRRLVGTTPARYGAKTSGVLGF